MANLYIVEGLPCSGKSTAAAHIAQITGGRLFDENCGRHPADYEFSAFIPDGADFTPEEYAVMKAFAETQPGGMVVPLEPVVIYLKCSDISSRIQSALPERGDEWLNFVVDYHCNGGYGKAHGLSEYDGYISALEERQRRELEFLPQLPVDHLILDDPQRDWNAAYRRADGFIS